MSLRFVITNPTVGPLYYSPCSASLEWDNGGRWEYVASTICRTDAPADPLDRTVTVLAGESREVGAFMSGRFEDGLPSKVPEGTYRLRFSVLSRLPVVWRGVVGVQYKGNELTTSEFTVPAPN